jgi:hypothetical protein
MRLSGSRSVLVLGLMAGATLGASGCGGGAIPDPQAAVAAYADAAARGDSEALYGMLTERSQQALGREGVRRAVEDARAELADHGAKVAAPGARVQAVARLRFADGEEVVVPLEKGQFRVASADVLPAGARTPSQALEQLRKALARRSYQALLRVMSRETRSAMERDLGAVVEGLTHPEALDVKIVGDQATISLPGGHLVRLRREGSHWAVDDFD